jgi:hypothetical protein
VDRVIDVWEEEFQSLSTYSTSLWMTLIGATSGCEVLLLAGLLLYPEKKVFFRCYGFSFLFVLLFRVGWKEGFGSNGGERLELVDGVFVRGAVLIGVTSLR